MCNNNNHIKRFYKTLKMETNLNIPSIFFNPLINLTDEVENNTIPVSSVEIFNESIFEQIKKMV